MRLLADKSTDLRSSMMMATQTSSVVSPKAALAIKRISDNEKDQSSTSSQGSDTVTVSTLAQQLSASASRIEARDKALTHSELADEAKKILSVIVGDAYDAAQCIHNKEIPNTSDPELLDRAKKATTYVTGLGKNPFAGLSPKQLSDIVYDDGGTYTVNERHAAWQESYDQEEAWREKVAAQATAEYNKTGKLTNYFRSVLSHFQGLSPIEQAQYPADYASDLQSKINLDFNYRTGHAEGDDKMPNLFELLSKKDPKESNGKDLQSALKPEENPPQTNEKSLSTINSSTATNEYS